MSASWFNLIINEDIHKTISLLDAVVVQYMYI